LRQTESTLDSGKRNLGAIDDFTHQVLSHCDARGAA
jgi:hypothetical protein